MLLLFTRDRSMCARQNLLHVCIIPHEEVDICLIDHVECFHYSPWTG